VATLARRRTGEPARQRDWWLRALLVLQSPRTVFAALRDDSDEGAEARQEPLVAVVFLAGIAGILATSVAGRLLDEADFDRLLLAVWAVVAGGLHGIVLYFAVGALVYACSYAAGSAGSYRRARHLLGFAVVPVALSLLLWPPRIALYGEDVFRRGGSDDGAGDAVFEVLFALFVGWSVVLLAVGIRTVHSWPWARSLAAAALPAALPALALARAYGLV
jgi:hypothetical protein